MQDVKQAPTGSTTMGGVTTSLGAVSPVGACSGPPDGAVSSGGGQWIFVDNFVADPLAASRAAAAIVVGSTGGPQASSPGSVAGGTASGTAVSAAGAKSARVGASLPTVKGAAATPRVASSASPSNADVKGAIAPVPQALVDPAVFKGTMSHLSRMIAAGGRGGKGGRARGFKPITLVLTAPFSLSSSGAGAFNPTVALTPDGNTGDWGALVTLYDEYKCSRICLEWSNQNVNAQGAQSPMLVAFDQADGAGLTSIAAGATLTRHRLSGATGVTSGGSYTYAKQNGSMYKLDVKLKPDTALTVSSGVGSIVAMPDTWTILNSAGNNIPLGWVRTYSSTTLTSGVILAGVIRYTCSFRSRE
jgi:hypothetical protein